MGYPPTEHSSLIKLLLAWNVRQVIYSIRPPSFRIAAVSVEQAARLFPVFSHTWYLHPFLPAGRRTFCTSSLAARSSNSSPSRGGRAGTQADRQTDAKQKPKVPSDTQQNGGSRSGKPVIDSSNTLTEKETKGTATRRGKSPTYLASNWRCPKPRAAC